MIGFLQRGLGYSHSMVRLCSEACETEKGSQPCMYSEIIRDFSGHISGWEASRYLACTSKMLCSLYEYNPHAFLEILNRNLEYHCWERLCLAPFSCPRATWASE